MSLIFIKMKIFTLISSAGFLEKNWKFFIQIDKYFYDQFEHSISISENKISRDEPIFAFRPTLRRTLEKTSIICR